MSSPSVLCSLVYGPIADRFGRRPVLLIAMSLYCVATVLCAPAPTFETLLCARALQGAAAAAAPARSGSHPRFIRRGRFAEGNELRDVSFRNIRHRSARYRGYPGCMERLAGIFFLLPVYALVTIAAVFVYLKETRPESAPTSFKLSTTFALYLRLTPNPQFALNCITNPLMYSAMFVWLSGSMLVIVDGYGIRPDIGGLCSPSDLPVLWPGQASQGDWVPGSDHTSSLSRAALSLLSRRL